MHTVQNYAIDGMQVLQTHMEQDFECFHTCLVSSAQNTSTYVPQLFATLSYVQPFKNSG